MDSSSETIDVATSLGQHSSSHLSGAGAIALIDLLLDLSRLVAVVASRRVSHAAAPRCP